MTSNFPDFYKSNIHADRRISSGKCTMKTTPQYITETQ